MDTRPRETHYTWDLRPVDEVDDWVVLLRIDAGRNLGDPDTIVMVARPPRCGGDDV